jgi:hypothetical protein
MQRTRDPNKPFDRDFNRQYDKEKEPTRRPSEERYHRIEKESKSERDSSTSTSTPTKSTFIDTSSQPTVQNQPPKTFLEKIWKFARNAGPRLKKMSEGFKEALFGGISAVKNPNVFQHMKGFALEMTLVLVMMYASLAFLCMVYAPLVLFFWFWIPGILLQTLSLVPLWSYNIARKRYPTLSNQLFLDEMNSLSPPRAKELTQLITQEPGLNKTWTEELYHDLKTSWHFTRFSLICSVFSIIPFFGPLISYLGQLWIVSDKMGWNLLSVYTISAKKMSYRQQKHWMRARKWRIIGFTMPYCLLASIPVIGPLSIIIAQAAIAHLYFHLLSKEGEQAINEKKSPFSSAPEAEKRAV